MASSGPHARATHLTDEVTSRDLYGTVRGACSCNKCGRYIIVTKEKYTSLHQERSKIAKHPDNDVSITYCSRCGCPPDAHAPVQWETEREAGNDAYALHRWDTAILHYTRAIDSNPVEAVLWTNRAAAYNAKGWHQQALHDAERAIALRGAEWYKPWARKGAACLGLERYSEAEVSYSTALRLAREHGEEESFIEVLQQGLSNSKKKSYRMQAKKTSSSTYKKGSDEKGSGGAQPQSDSPASSLAQEVAELRSRVAILELQIETLKSLLAAPTAESRPHIVQNGSESKKSDDQGLSESTDEESDAGKSTAEGSSDQESSDQESTDEESDAESSACTLKVEVGDQESDDGSDTGGSEYEFEDDRMMKEWMEQVKAAREALGCSSATVLVPPPPTKRRSQRGDSRTATVGQQQSKPPLTTSTEANATSSSSSQSSQSTELHDEGKDVGVDIKKLMDMLQQSERAMELGDHERCGPETESSAVPVKNEEEPSTSISPQEQARLNRIKATMERQREAEEAGEVLQSTNLDALTQAKRGMCKICEHSTESEERCKGFCVMYRTIDATNPEIMLYCSTCGCPADAHPVDEAWQAEEKERIAREAAFNNRRRTSHQFQSDVLVRRQHEEERNAFALLGLPPGSDSKAISKAYKRLALLMHPDKRNATGGNKRTAPPLHSEYDEQFVKVTHAYKLLMSRCR